MNPIHPSAWKVYSPKFKPCAPPGRLVRGRLQRQGATREGIVEAAKEDYRGLVEVHAGSLNHQQENKKNQQRSA